ncbi:MAG: hypothetical protein P8R54_16165 [Myxococcota bacterium]|nr:hypothetical protein [Myxococcota bacterium]
MVGCGSDGKVDRALSLSSGAMVVLPLSATSPGLSPAAVYVSGWGGGLLRLTERGAVEEADIPSIHQVPVAPPASDGAWAALLSEGRIQAADIHAPGQQLYEVSVAGWYPPALTDGHVAWVGLDDAGEEDVWWMALPDGEPALLSGGAGAQRHVVGAGRWLSWVEEDAVVLLDTESGQRQSLSVRTGFSAPPTLWDGVVCWEEWGADIDIVCSDGLAVRRPGHQQWPSRFGPWLLFREAGQVWLLTAD